MRSSALLKLNGTGLLCDFCLFVFILLAFGFIGFPPAATGQQVHSFLSVRLLLDFLAAMDAGSASGSCAHRQEPKDIFMHNMNPLLADICRCHDGDCPDHSQCARYLQAATGTFHARSIRGEAKHEPCRHFIAALKRHYSGIIGGDVE